VPAAVPTDEIYERYLRKAIGEINELWEELRGLGDAVHVPVLGSGHPLADVFLVKWAPQPAEIQEGIAFFGRSGQALLKSFQRLGVDPMAVYGTNCLKFGTEDPEQAAAWLTRELHPTIVGERQRFTATIEALVVPDIDASLDDQTAKNRFWNAFKALGPWWAELPPY
jgi:hypothetical protein